ncbi:MAG: HesA/MoeB/ThiF family protein [archaeon]
MKRTAFDPSIFYSRQEALREIGHEGQMRLKRSTAAIIGLGGLGSVSATYLALAGVGHLRLVDQDTVELHNLHRQMLYAFEDLRLPKAEKAATRLSASNPDISVEAIPENLREDNVDRIVQGADIVLDGLDNMRTRYVLNKACFRHRIPYVFGGAIAMEGNVAVFNPPETPCLECVLPNVDDATLPGCDTRGVLGATAGIVGSIQAMEALKKLSGVRMGLGGKLLVCDFTGMDFDKIEVFRNPACKTCGQPTEAKPASGKLTWLCGGDTVNINPERDTTLDLERTRLLLENHFHVLARSAWVLVFKMNGHEVSLFRNGRALVKGCKTENEAIHTYERVMSLLGSA